MEVRSTDAVSVSSGIFFARSLTNYMLVLFMVLVTSGFTAVLSVNIVIGLYILSAWKEDDGKEVAPPVGRFAKAKEQ